jgi:hypothetical protein
MRSRSPVIVVAMREVATEAYYPKVFLQDRAEDSEFGRKPWLKSIIEL